MFLQPAADEIKDAMTILHHGADRRSPAGPAVAAIVHCQKIDPHPVINRAQVIIIRHNFSIAMEKQDVATGWMAHVKPGTNCDILCHRDQDIHRGHITACRVRALGCNGRLRAGVE